MNKFGCSFLEKGINFDLDTVCDCCISHNDGRGLPKLIKNYHGELIDWEKLFEVKARRIKMQQEKTIYDCEGCYHLNDYQFSGEKKIKEFHFSHSRMCNAKCVYCSDLYSSGTKNYDTYPVIKDLIDKGYYEPGGEATMQGGEPTIMLNFDNLVDLFITNGTKIRVHTSGIKCSDKVVEALKHNNGSVVISIDSGCRETYKKIKQVDAFDNVLNTIKRYIEAVGSNKENFILKYVIVPGYNDNLDEVDKFFFLVRDYGITTVAVDIEVQYAQKYNNKDVSEHIFLLDDYFKYKAKEFNVNLLTYSFFSYVLQNRQVGESDLIKNRFLYNVFFNLKNDKSKNMSYRR